MKNKITLLILFVTLSVTNVFAQQKSIAEQVDSIEIRLPQLHGDEKLEAIHSLIKLTTSLPVQKQQYATMLRDEAWKQKNVQQEGHALAALIWVYFFQFDTDSIFIVGEEAIRFMREHKLYEDLFIIQQTIIMRYEFHGQYLTALRKAEEAYAEARRLQEYMPMARMLSAIGGIYATMGQNQEAIRCYAESLEAALQNRQNDTFFYIENYHNLASSAEILQRYDESLRYADSMQVELERYRQHNPGVDLQDYDFSLYYCYAIAYAGLGQTEQSLQAMRKAEELYNPIWNGDYLEAALNEIYVAYFFATGNYDRAMEHIRYARRYYEDNRYVAGVMDKIIDEANVHFERGNHKAAAETYRYFIQKKDSLNNDKFYAQINELRTIYELDKAELEAQQRLVVIQRQRFAITSLIVSGGVLLLIAILVVRNRNRIAEKNRALYRQIREQDKLAERLAAIEEEQNREELQLAETEKNGVAAPIREKHKQYMIVSQMNDYLISDRNFIKPDVNIDKIAEQIGISRTSLYQAIKEVKGDEKPQEYIHNFRLEETRRLLDHTHLPIKAIASQCGYTLSTFYRQFQEKYEISPAEYRKIKKQEEAG